MPQWLTLDDVHNEALLTVEVARAFKRAFDGRAKAFGLTRAQWQLLGTLRRYPGVNQRKLACLLDIQPITLTRLLDRMEKTGWIERRPDTNDRRAHLIYLTTRAEAIAGNMRRLALDLRRQAIAGLDEADHAQLVRLLTRIKHNLCAQNTREEKNHAE